MSGIYGIFHKKGAPVEEHMLQAIGLAMAEWGSDGNWCWHEHDIGLGLLLMHSTPESLYEVPPHQERANQRYHFVADARIDNREQLCDIFRIPSSERATCSDGQLVQLAFQKWGSDCPKELIGAYAFAVWDRSERRLFLARDQMGFRPLYVYEDGHRFVFASDIRAILTVEGVSQQLDHDAIIAMRTQRASYLVERSPFQAIHKVPPAHFMIVEQHHCRKQKFWSPENSPSVRLSSNYAYAEQMLALVTNAVSCRLRSSFPIGSHLSGGLDSSAITVLASRQLRQQGRQLSGAFSWSPPPTADESPLQDERSRIEEIRKLEGIPCHYNRLTDDQLFQLWQDDIRLRPQANTYNEESVRHQAAAQGIRVLLSGWGGDEFATFHGTGFFSEKLLRLQWHTFIDEMAHRRQTKQQSLKHFLWQEVVLPLLPRHVHAQRSKRLPKAIKADPFISAKTKHSLHMMMTDYAPRPFLHRNLLRPFDCGSIVYRLDGWVAQGIANRIEYRYPLLDVRLIEFCLGLPLEQFVQNGWSRFIFRNAMNHVLPKHICWTTENKAEPRRLTYTTGQVTQAGEAFCQQYRAGKIKVDGVSSFWKDKIFDKYLP